MQVGYPPPATQDATEISLPYLRWGRALARLSPRPWGWGPSPSKEGQHAWPKFPTVLGEGWHCCLQVGQGPLRQFFRRPVGTENQVTVEPDFLSVISSPPANSTLVFFSQQVGLHSLGRYDGYLYWWLK